jgi:molybdopterin-guanine dinucleotide biosynthesis protein A
MILAGGESRRLGLDKAEVRIGGEALWQRQARVLRSAGADRIAIVRRPGQPAPAALDCRRDLGRNAGPIAGLHAALQAGTSPWTAVLAVDMPGIDADWFRRLRQFCRPGVGAVARHADAFEPLAAIYPAEALPEVAARLWRRDLSLQRLCRSLAEQGRMSVLPLAAAEAGRTASVNTAAALLAAGRRSAS